MAFRFQKRIKVLPGITLNLSRKGVSTSFGVTGARVTLGHGKTRTTVGLPGTGLSHTSISGGRASYPTNQEDRPAPSAARRRGWTAIAVALIALFGLWTLYLIVSRN